MTWLKNSTTSKVSRMSKALVTKFRKKKYAKASKLWTNPQPPTAGPSVSYLKKRSSRDRGSGRAVELEAEVDPDDGVVVLEEVVPPIGSGSGSGSGRSGPRPPLRRPPRSLGRSRLRDLSDLSTRSRTSEGSQTQMPCGWSAVLTKSKFSR